MHIYMYVCIMLESRDGMDLSALESIMIENFAQRPPGDDQVQVHLHQYVTIQALALYAPMHPSKGPSAYRKYP